jgi:hypothetical protein
MIDESLCLSGVVFIAVILVLHLSDEPLRGYNEKFIKEAVKLPRNSLEMLLGMKRLCVSDWTMFYIAMIFIGSVLRYSDVLVKL